MSKQLFYLAITELHVMFDTGLLPVLAIIILIPLVWVVSKLHKPVAIKGEFRFLQREAVTAVGMVVAIFSAITIVFFFWAENITRLISTWNQASPFSVAFEWAFYGLFFFVPVLAVVKIKRQGLESVGVSKKNLKFSLIIGIAFSLVWLIIGFSSSPLSFQRVFTSSSFYLFLYYAAIGFGEELLFRGYLQHRCTAWLGNTTGLIVSSIIMAFAHIPQRVFVLGLSPVEAISSSVFLIPVSVLLGLLFLRTQNVIGPSVFHTILDFANTL